MQAGKFDEMEDESIRKKQDPSYAEQLQQIRDELKGGAASASAVFVSQILKTLLPWLLVLFIS